MPSTKNWWTGEVDCTKASPKDIRARFQSAPLWLEERIREALTERTETVTPAQFEKNMKAVADGR